MTAKKFHLDFSPRVGLKKEDIILVNNSDTGVDEVATLEEVCSIQADVLLTGELGDSEVLAINQKKVTEVFSTKADKSTEVIAGDGLTGGGSLTGNITLNVASANDGIKVNADNIELETIDALDSDSVTKPLSAKQGKVLNTNKVDKVIGAVSGNFASLDTNGNLLDSDYKASDFVEVVNIANNLTETDAGKVLDARQGKVLNEAKVDKVTGKQLSTEDYTTTEKNKLSGIAENANNYTHPANHPPSIITQDTDNRFVTDAEKSTWNAKQSALGYTPENVANKKQTITNSETDYPSGKAAFDALALKVDKVAGKGLSTNDYDATEKAAVANSVQKTGNETIAGVKTFSSSPIVPAPTTDLQAATKKYVDDAVSQNWVGVIIDPALSSSEPAPKSTVVAYRATEIKRTGNLNFHKFGQSRIFNAIYPAIVVRSTRKVAWRLDKNDFTKKDDGSVSVPDWTIHNICIVIPRLWRRIVLLDGVDTGRYEVRYDIAPFEGAEVFCNETAHSIGFASMDRTTTQLVSVISNDVRFRGGNNTSTNDANPWNWNSFLGKPATVISRTGFENNAAAAGWETGNIWDRTLWQQLMWLYFANTNIQLAYTSVLTAEGYPQGGLGAGVTNWSSFRWNAKNEYYPINTVGAGSLSVGCKVGVRDMVDDKYYIGRATGVAANSIVATSHFSTANGWSASYIGLTIQNMTTLAEATIVSKTDDSTLVLSADIFPTSGQWFWIKGVNYSYQIPVFFGIEHLYGELWDWVSGINIEKQAVAEGAVSRAFVCKDFSKRSATITADYRFVSLVPRTDGYIKTLYPELNIARIIAGSSSTTFISDYAYMTTFPASGVGVYGCLFGGNAHNGGLAGSGYVTTNYAPSTASTSIGSRLRAEIVV